MVDRSTAQGKLVKIEEDDLLDYFQTNAKSVSVQNLYWNSLVTEVIALPEIAIDAVAVEDEAEVDSPEVSSTNLQEEGVDEADLIKTDGRYLYSVDKSNYAANNIRIMDTQSAGGLAEVSNLNSVDEESLSLIHI